METETTATPPHPQQLPPTPAFAHGSLLVGTAGGDALRWVVTDLGAVVEEARRRLDLSPVSAAALGRAMAGSVLLLRLAVKTPARLVMEIRGDGPLGTVVAEADELGNLRGMVGEPRLDLPSTPEGKLDVSRAVGRRGRLRVIREREGSSYASQVELVTGEIGDDVAHFLDQSEQTRSAVLLGVLARPGGIAAAGGMIIERMPGAPEEVIDRLEANLEGLAGISRLLEETASLDASLDRLLAGLDPEVLEQRPITYRCRCSRERLRRHLVLLARREEDLLAPDRDELEAECSFCGTEYRFTHGELEPEGS